MSPIRMSGDKPCRLPRPRVAGRAQPTSSTSSVTAYVSPPTTTPSTPTTSSAYVSGTTSSSAHSSSLARSEGSSLSKRPRRHLEYRTSYSASTTSISRTTAVWGYPMSVASSSATSTTSVRATSASSRRSRVTSPSATYATRTRSSDTSPPPSSTSHVAVTPTISQGRSATTVSQR